MPLAFAADTPDAIPLFLVDPDGSQAWKAGLEDRARAWVEASGFQGRIGQAVLLPGADGKPQGAAVGLGDAAQRARTRFALAAAREKLPKGAVFRLDTTALGAGLSPDDLENEALGWLLSGYRFDRYRAGNGGSMAELVAPAGVDARRLEIIAAGERLTRDLVNTPANDLGPAELAKAATDLAAEMGATCEVIEGAALTEGFPLIAAVGGGSGRPPRLIDMRWGDGGPRVTLVGKGICFDTGGLDIKPSSAMALMKKDMGGAATVLGLARMIMGLGLDIRLRVLIPAAENAVSGRAFRPGDILRSRKGLTVEVNNTDAEGRLVLADALALATEEETNLVVSMATLTGAARVAVGPDLAPFYATSDGHAQALERAGRQVADPVWRLPFWEPYEDMIEPGIADLDNAPRGGFAGSITAALFLRRFVGTTAPFLHFDIYAWQPKAAPGRPKGGVGQGARALLQALPELVGG